MRLSPILSLYLGRKFLAGIGLVFLVMAALVFLVDLVNTLGQAGDQPETSFGAVLALTALRLPSLAEKLLPFATLFGGIWTFSRLTRSHELIVARAGGVSVWQFMAPALVLAMLIGVFVMTVYNPIAAAMAARFEQLEAHYLEGRSSSVTFSATGLWLRQADPRGQAVIHALNAADDGLALRNVIVFLYEGSDHFAARIDAKRAELEDGHWRLEEALITRPEGDGERFENYRLATSLTPEQIRESFASPETLSFWHLPRFIETMEEAGFSAVRHQLHWQVLLSTPLLLCAMVLLAATFSLRLTRLGHSGLLVAFGVLAGFVLYFLSDVVYALGMAGSVPVSLAAWAPAGIATLVGLAMLFHLEDG